jgi:small subunit ribosomal protein S15
MITKQDRIDIVNKFGSDTHDTGSTSVQIALLTKEIQLLTEHCKQHPKDYSTRLGLLKKVCNRRKFLSYLSRRKYSQYRALIQELGLKK